MKKQIVGSCLIFFFISSICFAQTERLDYKKIDYLKVDQDNYEMFMEKCAKVLKPAFEKLVQSNKVKKWRLYVVDYPGGNKSDYNFVSITTTTGVDAIENSFPRSGSAGFIPDADHREAVSQLADIVDLHASEIWKVRSLIRPDTTEEPPSPYMTMDYMNVVPGKGLEYLMLEDEVAMPLHKERVKRNNMIGWEVYSLVIPGGTEYGYNYATGNYFEDIADVEFGFTQELIQQTMPGTDVGDLLNTIYETRDLVKSELWKLVMHVN